MKKVVVFLAVAAFVALCSCCGGQGENISKKKLIGTWIDQNNDLLVIAETGRLSGKIGGDSVEAEWTVAGNKLALKWKEERYNDERTRLIMFDVSLSPDGKTMFLGNSYWFTKSK